MLIRIPIAAIIAISDDLPSLASGSVIPTTGGAASIAASASIAILLADHFNRGGS